MSNLDPAQQAAVSRPDPPLLAFSVAVWSGIHPIEYPDDPQAEQCHLMSTVVLAYTRGQAEELAAAHFRDAVILEDSAIVLCSAVEITLSLPELLRVIPGLHVQPASEEVSYTRGEIHAGRWYMTAYGNPGKPACGMLTDEVRRKLREREQCQGTSHE